MDFRENLTETERALEIVEGRLAQLLEACYSKYYITELFGDEDLCKRWSGEGHVPNSESLLEAVNTTIALLNELVTSVDRLKPVAQALKEKIEWN